MDWRGALGLVIRKIVTLLIVLLLVLTIEFLFFRVGLGTEHYLSGGMPPGQAALIEEKLHANESILVQYFYFIGDMLTGKGSFDLYSYSAHRPVADVIDDSFWLTLLLFGTTLVLSLLLGLLCAYALWRSRSRTSRAVGSASLLLLWAVPVVLVALFFLLQVVFRFKIDWAFHRLVDYSTMDQLERLIYQVELRIFPVLALTMCSFGGFALMALQGLRRIAQDQQKAPNGRDLKRPSFSECVVSVLPNMKLNIAFIMSCVIVIEPLWNLYGIGFRAQAGMANNDVAIVEVCVFLVLLTVLVSCFILDLCSSLVAAHSRRAYSSAGQIVGGERPVEPSPGEGKSPKHLDPLGEVRRFVSEFRRSVPGVVGAVMLAAMAVLALIGPALGDHRGPSLPIPEDSDPLDQFLLGARDPFLYALAVLALSIVIGFFAGILCLPLGKFNYPVVLVAEAFIIFPIVGLFFMILMLPHWSRLDDFFWRIVLSAVLVAWAPVALVILNRSKDIGHAYDLRSPKETGIARYRGLLTAGARETIPDAVASLKYVAVVSSLSIFAIEFAASGAASWGGMVFHYMQYSLTGHDIEFNLWWIYPLFGIVVMASGFYLVLQATQDILEKRLRPAREASPALPSPPSGP